MGLIHAFLLVSRDAFFECSLGWGLWLANNLKEEGFDFIGEHFHFNRKWISGGWIVQLLSSFSQKELCYQLDLKDKLNSEILEAK
ncbi:hypothetical protein [Peribacillus simplex]|uniref:hypothetical protein n=1 Tax=Peribacillus simplex TaxID=1478 RepID=UPI00366C25C8